MKHCFGKCTLFLSIIVTEQMLSTACSLLLVLVSIKFKSFLILQPKSADSGLNGYTYSNVLVPVCNAVTTHKKLSNCQVTTHGEHLIPTLVIAIFCIIMNKVGIKCPVVYM